MNLIILTIVLLKKLIDADYSVLTKENQSTHEAYKFKVNDRVRITKYKNIFGSEENWSREIFGNNSVLKNNPLTYTIKYLNAEKEVTLGTFL